MRDGSLNLVRDSITHVAILVALVLERNSGARFFAVGVALEARG
jgi:hypothetical protein